MDEPSSALGDPEAAMRPLQDFDPMEQIAEWSTKLFHVNPGAWRCASDVLPQIGFMMQDVALANAIREVTLWK